MPTQTVFVSYAREDIGLVQPIRNAIESAGLKFVDGGDLQLAGLLSAIPSAAIFIACFSLRTTGSAYAKDELEIAIAELRAFRRDRTWLIPYRLNACELPAMPISESLVLSDLLELAPGDIVQLRARLPVRSEVAARPPQKIHNEVRVTGGHLGRGSIIGSDQQGAIVAPAADLENVVTVDNVITDNVDIAGSRTRS